MSSHPSNRRRPRAVWIVIFEPTPDHPPRHRRIEKVFMSEGTARDWALERNRSGEQWYYRVEHHEVAQ